MPTAITSMMLQSYQENIHVFPDWPTSQDASFGDLLAVGHLLVSSSMVGGQVESVTITSQHGGVCHLANPRGAERPVNVQIDEGRSTTLRGSVLTFAARAGERRILIALQTYRHDDTAQP